MRALLLLLFASTVFAQVIVRPVVSPKGPGSVSVKPDPRPMTAITGAPWSGIRTTEETLTDGTHVAMSTEAQFRDSLGRTRIEHSERGFGPSPVVEINDPVAGYTYVLDSVNHVAYRIVLKAKTRVAVEAVRPCNPSGSTSKTMADGSTATSEWLGAKTIQGIAACGLKTTIVRKDNAPPFVSELWMASGDIGGMLLSRNSGPNGSVILTEFKEIQFNEPEASLFEPPAGYRIQDETAAFTIERPAAAGAATPVGRSYAAITGLPFSAETMNGDRVVSLYYRDSAGRTRREPAAPSKANIVIIDVVAGFMYSIDPATQAAHRRVVKIAPAVAASTVKMPPPSGTTTQKLQGGVTALNEWLGTQTIGGLETYGTRVTLTYPPGSMNNDKTVSTVNESWISPKLGLPVLMKNSGALTGSFTDTLGAVKYIEPDAALFQVPAGYRIIAEN